jgi:molybdate transport system substrate-binding protein
MTKYGHLKTAPGGRLPFCHGAGVRRFRAFLHLATGPCRLAVAVAAAWLAVMVPVASEAANGERVLLFAAASTTAPVERIVSLFRSQGLGAAAASFASSSILAKQIANGAPADIYISANPGWMDFLAAKRAIVPASRFDLLGNRLVLIVPAGSILSLRIARDFPFAEKLAGGRLAMGDPDHVPAGIYGKAAFERLGLWRALAGRVVRTQDARAVLALVERGEAAAGVAYASDARITSRVRVAASFPAASHPPITYPAAIVAGRDRPEVRRFFDFFRSPQAAAVFAEHGFTVIPAAAP